MQSFWTLKVGVAGRKGGVDGHIQKMLYRRMVPPDVGARSGPTQEKHRSPAYAPPRAGSCLLGLFRLLHPSSTSGPRSPSTSPDPAPRSLHIFIAHSGPGLDPGCQKPTAGRLLIWKPQV
ncbi:hypothetical protein CABS01_17273 [Colletotrichum abscissum]|uniref:uncharacterized protein n=1 Tax=Colletotrichum abscissum TaxID=1671311 RepID=UPI0027D59299|nr:uncharacterized protein CABS01_17273 [Colletotrichum abscissum]KAK1479372.1 hypothetical protein CABS01_17273 [Colletotrichum abscissum]